MFLATTAIQEFWNLENKLLLLGPWCLLGEKNKKLLAGKDYIMVPSPWKPASRIKEAADYTLSVYEELLPRLSEALNSINKVSYPVKYWRILIGPWLLHFLGVFYERYKRIEYAMRIFPDCYTYTISEPLDNVATLNTLDFLNYKMNDDFYNLKLFSFIINKLYPERAKQIDGSSISKTDNFRGTYSWKGKWLENFLKAINVFCKSSIILSDMYHLNKNDMLSLTLKSGINTANFRHFTPVDYRYPMHDFSSNLRGKLINHKEVSDQFLSLFYNILPHAIPTCYIENYEFYRKEIRNSVPVKVVGSAVGWVFNERFKFFAAEAASKGAQIIEFQHGGGYGLSSVNITEELSLDKDLFYTWGWTSEDNSKARPLPSPHLSKLEDKYHLELDNLLFVGMNIPRYFIRFSTDLFPDDMPKYFEDKKAFLSCLQESIKEKLLYRPFPYDYGWQEKEFIRQEVPNIKFVDKEKLVELKKKVKLVVIDHQHTSFLEALIINVPCILYWDHDVYRVRSEVEPYFEELRRVSVLFKDPLSAAKQVNKIFDSPNEWWLNREVQDARLKFCKRFAYARNDWVDLWAEEFKRVRERNEDIILHVV